jgi:hypothetical protein
MTYPKFNVMRHKTNPCPDEGQRTLTKHQILCEGNMLKLASAGFGLLVPTMTKSLSLLMLPK